MFINGASDALVSNGFVSTLSNLFVCLDNDGVLMLNSNTITDDLNIRNVLSKFRNDGITNIVTIVQNHMQSLWKSAPFLGCRIFLHKGILKKDGIREGKGCAVLKVDIA